MHRAVRLLPAVAACIGVAVQAPLVSTRQRYWSATDLIAVTVTVRDRDGHLVKNLSQDAFELYEDGQRRPVTQFTNERVPVSFGILLDISDSMFGRRIQEARAAIEQFIVNRLDPADEFSLLAFNHRYRVLTAWTNDRSAAAKALEPVSPSGSTAIYDAIIGALPFAELRTRERAALVVISDGADTASDATIRDVRLALARSEAFVYAIAIDPPESVPLNTRVNLTALGEVTGQSGGRTLVMRNTSEMLAALSEIAEELDNQYLLGYIAPNAADGQFHGIRVRVANSDYRVRARNGYIVEPARPPSRP